MIRASIRRVRSQKFGDVLVLLVILAGLATMIYTIKNSLVDSKLTKQRARDEQCIIDLQRLDQDRSAQIAAIARDDRRAVDLWVSRVSRDVLISTRASIADIPKAYESYRQDRADNDARRASLGSSVHINSACDYGVTRSGYAQPLPSLSVPPSAKPTPSPTSPLPALPSVVEVPGPTETVTVTATRNVPGPTDTITISRPGRTVTFTVPVPGPTATETVTITKRVPRPTVTVTITVPVPTVIPTPLPSLTP